jgi:hypothetical protein
MATQRLSQLHKRILQWLVADHQRTKGFIWVCPTFYTLGSSAS